MTNPYIDQVFEDRLRILQAIEALRVQMPYSGAYVVDFTRFGIWDDPQTLDSQLAALREIGILEYTLSNSLIHGSAVRVKNVNDEKLLAEKNRIRAILGASDENNSSPSSASRRSHKEIRQFFASPVRKVVAIATAIVAIAGAAGVVSHLYSDLFDHATAHHITKPHPSSSATRSISSPTAP